MVTRRKVLQGAVAAAAGSTFRASAQFAAETGWFDKPMRWAQLNSTEDDAAQMDIPFWLDYFNRIHADALCITAGGVVAFYPTKIPYHHRSQFLADRDLFGDFTKAAKERGMRVVARLDCNLAYEEALQARP